MALTERGRRLPCWPDLWLHLKNAFPLLGAAVLYLALSVFLLWAPKLRTRWKRITSRVIGVLCLAPFLVVLSATLLGLALGDSPSAQTKTVRSQNGQEARLKYEAGFLGRDYSEITLKRAGCCQHNVVFWHQGPSWFDDPKMDWLDNQHLKISYHARVADRQYCDHQVKDIIVDCESLPLPSGLPKDPPVQQPSAKNP